MARTIFDTEVRDLIATDQHANGNGNGEYHAQAVKLRKEQLVVERDARAALAAESWKMPRPLPWGSLAAVAPRFLINGYLQEGTVGLLVGAYGTGKSFLALDWGASIASGTAWQNNPTPTGGNVLYVAAEGGMGMGRRRLAWQQTYGMVKDETFSFIPQPVPLGVPEGVTYLCEQIRHLDISFIVIDTLARSIAGLNENDSMEMGVIIDALYQLRDARETEGTTVLVVHHLGKDASRGARGSSRLMSDVDFGFQIKDEESHFALTSTKVKDDATPQPLDFRLSQVSIGAMSSCVIERAVIDTSQRLCRQCSEVLVGPSNKIYCDDACRKRYERAKESSATSQSEGYKTRRSIGRGY